MEQKVFVPKYLRNIIEVKFEAKYWKVCDSPKTHCSLTEVNGFINICGFNLLKLIGMVKQIGPALMIFDFNLDMGFKLNLVLINNIITVGHFKLLSCVKFYSKRRILNIILTKLFFLLFIIFVSIISYINYLISS